MRSSRRCSLAVALSCGVLVPVAQGLDLAGEAAYGAAAPAPAVDHAPLVRLSLLDLYGLAPDVVGRAEAEAAAVLGLLGGRAELGRARPGDTHDPRALLIVVMPGDPGPLLRRTVLGAVQRDSPTRVLWIFPRTIAAALGLTGDAAGRPTGERAAFAIALGRVIAHEVVHLTCPWREHDRSGLMAARMTRALLRGAAVPVEAALRRDFVLGATAQSDRSPRVALTGE
jgi:hypothetical protein